MRIQCDVCVRNLASVMCCADEAALCAECDTRIHAANKLANKHVRVPLLTVLESPNCDICQEKRAFFFCLEDRALLCRDCDVSIHKANTLSCNHKRFLVTGTRVALDAIKEEPAEPLTPELQSPLPSATSTLQKSCSSASQSSQLKSGTTYRVPAAAPAFVPCSHAYIEKAQGVTEPKMTSHEVQAPKLNPAPLAARLIPLPSLGTGLQSSSLLRKSSISEFLTDAVPGWRVDELLNFSDLGEGFNMNDIASTKADIGLNAGDFDWTADLSLFEEQMFADAFHEVPQIPSTPALAALPRSTRPTKLAKGKSNKQDTGFLPTSFDDAFLVPDLGIPSRPVSTPFPKRRRNYYDINA